MTATATGPHGPVGRGCEAPHAARVDRRRSSSARRPRGRVPTLWGRLALCGVVALALQVGTNYANDYCRRRPGHRRAAGRPAAARRVGPRVAVVGPRAPRSRRYAVAGGAGCGSPPSPAGGSSLVGAAALAAGWGYTGGPRPYGYDGLGEPFVFVFFGLVATAGTTYCLTGQLTALAVRRRRVDGLRSRARCSTRTTCATSTVTRPPASGRRGPARSARAAGWLYVALLAAGVASGACLRGVATRGASWSSSRAAAGRRAGAGRVLSGARARRCCRCSRGPRGVQLVAGRRCSPSGCGGRREPGTLRARRGTPRSSRASRPGARGARRGPRPGRPRRATRELDAREGARPRRRTGRRASRASTSTGAPARASSSPSQRWAPTEHRRRLSARPEAVFAPAALEVRAIRRAASRTWGCASQRSRNPSTSPSASSASASAWSRSRRRARAPVGRRCRATRRWPPSRAAPAVPTHATWSATRPRASSRRGRRLVARRLGHERGGTVEVRRDLGRAAVAREVDRARPTGARASRAASGGHRRRGLGEAVHQHERRAPRRSRTTASGGIDGERTGERQVRRRAGGVRARRCFDEFARGGMRDVVVCPGSRSTPLVLAALATHGAPAARPARRALGGLLRDRPRARDGRAGRRRRHVGDRGRRAHRGGRRGGPRRVPLVVMTADRPPELRGVGAPQTIDQVKLFGARCAATRTPGRSGPGAEALVAPLAARVLAAAAIVGRGPVHLNVPLVEPLDVATVARCRPGRADGAPWRRLDAPPVGVDAAPDAPRGSSRARRRRAACGDARRRSLAASARHGWPVLADPLSGARVAQRTVVAEVRRDRCGPPALRAARARRRRRARRPPAVARARRRARGVVAARRRGRRAGRPADPQGLVTDVVVAPPARVAVAPSPSCLARRRPPATSRRGGRPTTRCSACSTTAARPS